LGELSGSQGSLLYLRERRIREGRKGEGGRKSILLQYCPLGRKRMSAALNAGPSTVTFEMKGEGFRAALGGGSF